MKSPMQLLQKMYHYLTLSKQDYELQYWKAVFKSEHSSFENNFYEKLMLSIAEEPVDDFLKGKIVGDFGCGPRGSLVWAKQARIRIGIDVLAQKYIQCFSKELLHHQMIYLTCSEQTIPIPDATLDVIFSVNSLDHVFDLAAICQEIRRILTPGGLLIGSFNLNHQATKAEPQTLTTDKLKHLLFDGYQILSWRMSAPGNHPVENIYAPFYNDKLIDPKAGKAILWAKARKL